MTITTEQMTWEEMTETAKTHFCGECGALLTVAWSAEHNGYVLRCGANRNHHSITRHRPTSDYEKEVTKEDRRIRKMDTKSLTKMDTTQMLARVNMAKFPQELSQNERQTLVEAAITYGFDPLMGEIMIYQGRPYVSIDGRYRMAQETRNLDGVESRPATKQERQEWGIPDGDYFFRAEVFVKGVSRPFVGWGRVLQAETGGGKGFKPVEKNPQRMAEKRAEAQALRKAFHIPLPSVEDIGAPEDESRVKVNIETGEIIEGQATELPKQPEPVKESPIDLTYIKESLAKLKLTNAQFLTEYELTGKTITEAVTLLTPDGAKAIVDDLNKRLVAEAKKATEAK